MNSFLNQFKNSRGKYDAKKIFWELLGILYAAIIVAVLVAIIANLLYLSKKFN